MGFWSVVIATIALIVSSWNQIKSFFIKGKLDIDLHSRINLGHYSGVPAVQMPIIIRNIGGSSLRIINIKIDLTRDKTEEFSLSAQTYLDPTKNVYILFTKFPLEANKEWNHNIYFSNYLSRDDNKELKKAILERDKAYPQFRRINNMNINPDNLLEVNDRLEQPFNSLFDNNFKWKSGDYTLNLVIETEDKIANFQKKYRFTIFESQSEMFKEEKRNLYLNLMNTWEQIEIQEEN